MPSAPEPSGRWRTKRWAGSASVQRRPVADPAGAAMVRHQPRADLIGVPGQGTRERTPQRGSERAGGFVDAAERFQCTRVHEPRTHLARRKIVVGIACDDGGEQGGRVCGIAARQRELGPRFGDLDTLERLDALGCVQRARSRAAAAGA